MPPRATKKARTTARGSPRATSAAVAVTPVGERTGDSSRTVKFNVGGTKYEVSQSVLDQFPDSMLRRISSDNWKESATDAETNDIFIDRNGDRFQYVLDYMRDGRVALPISVPRGQLLADLKFLGIDFLEENITLSFSDPKDLFHGLAAYNSYFEGQSSEINARYREVAAEKLACDIATKFFSQLVHKPNENPMASLRKSEDHLAASTAKHITDVQSVNFFGTTKISVSCPLDHRGLANSDIMRHLAKFGLVSNQSSWRKRPLKIQGVRPEKHGNFEVDVSLFREGVVIGHQPR